MQQHPLEQARRWLEQSREDLVDAEHLLNALRSNTVCFLAQQSAEKACKALLLWHTGAIPRLHLIAELVRQLQAADLIVPAQLATRALALDKYYTTTRYPDVLDYALPSASFTLDEATLAYRAALELNVFADSCLPSL